MIELVRYLLYLLFKLFIIDGWTGGRVDFKIVRLYKFYLFELGGLVDGWTSRF